MKKSLKSILLLGCLNFLYANTTMCFKENHPSIATIENAKLNGGECRGKYSLNDMKTKGWSVEDIKITSKKDSYNFIYILKNQSSLQNNSISSSSSNMSDDELEMKIMRRMQKKKEEQKRKKKEEKRLKQALHGEKLYKRKCSRCHGQKGEIKAYKMKALNSLEYEDIKYSIARYTNDKDFGNGKQAIMRPYAVNISSKELKDIYEYIKSAN